MSSRLLNAALAIASVAAFASSAAHAQLSLTSAVGLALRSDPRVSAAQADVDKARAQLAEAKDAYVPVVGAVGGVGKSTGVPLSVPTIFTISAQSLVMNWSQLDYVRSAHVGWNATQFALQQAEDDVAEDVIVTYLALNNAQQRKAAAQQALDHAQKLLSITQDRVASGVDAHIEIPRAHRTVVSIQLQMLSIDSDIATYSDHLEHMTGLVGAIPATSTSSIPALPDVATLTSETMPPATISPALQAALANETAKLEQAHGDARYLYLPQMSFGASYARITTDFSSYATYYPAFDNPSLSRNALSLGIQINLPLLDQAHRAKARQSAADARRAHAEVVRARNQFLEGRLKLEHSATELELNTEAAQDDVEEARDSLQAVLIQLQPSAGAVNNGQQPLSPKDEQKARLNISQKELDLLHARQQLLQVEISLMRQTGQLSAWLHTVHP
ncbi:MAG: TolC family protein [Acidobacteriaceae bacterium]|nr:TolC family protein [Acidobacteriaceae bacterium]